MSLIRDDLDRRIVRLALPALGTLAVEPMYVLVDTAIAGHLGTDVLGGLGIAAVVLLTITSLVGFLQYAITPVVAYLHGAGQPAAARRAAGDAVALAALLGLAVAAIVALAAPPVVHVLGGRGAVADNAVLYLRIMAIGLPFALVVLAGHGVMRGVNRLGRPLVIVAVANALNVVLEIAAVYGLGWGLAGSAWSTVAAQALAALWFLQLLRPELQRSAPSWARYRPLLVAGGHLGLRAAAMLVVWVASTAVAARVDTPTLAANQIANQLFMFLALALDALAIPAQSLVAGSLGSGDTAGAVRVGDAATRLSLWSGLLVAVPLAVLSPLIPHAFSGDADVARRATAALVILAVIQLPGAVAFALDGALIGANDERFLARAAIGNLAGFLPFAVAVAVVPRFGIIGLWGGQLAWIVTRAMVNVVRWRRGRWMARHTANVAASA